MLKVFGADDSDIHRMLLMLLADGERVAMRNPLPQVQQAFHPQWPEARLPDGASLLSACDYQEIPKGLAGGLQMIHNRRLDHWMDWAYSGEDWQFKNRIILPYRFRGAIVGYNARLINHHEKSKFPKYITAKPPGFVFNLDNQRKKSKSVIITEGDFDAITVGGVSLGTNSASHEQISLISQLKKQPILCPDADQAGEKLIDTAIRAGWYVSFPEWMHEFKDANAAAEKYGRSFVIASILNAATKNSTKIQVLAKMMLT
jgi:5S rRNA maturation endonuclease (ribonuclease M5)